MRILTVCAEFAPLAKVGGLGDVTAGLTGWLARRGHEVAVVIPYYGAMAGEGVQLEPAPVFQPRQFPVAGAGARYAVHRLADPAAGPAVYLVDCPALFGGGIYDEGEREALRFMLLSRAALETAGELALRPDIVHCHDWHASPAAVLLKGPFRGERSLRQAYAVLTLHNIGYQGVFPEEVLDAEPGLSELFAPEDAARGEANFLRAGILQADALTTVSPTHAREIQTPEYGHGLDELLRQRRHRLAGILNGVDYAQWSPDCDPLLPAHFSVQDPAGKRASRSALLRQMHLEAPDNAPVVGLVSRLAAQKGIDLIVESLPALLAQRPFACAFLGNGELRYVSALQDVARRFPGRVAHVDAHDEMLAHLVLAGSDLLLVPSLYEPCGLTQLYAMRYGTVPVVRMTGGLADTVEHFDPATGRGTGSVFRDPNAEGLTWGLRTALDWFGDRRSWAQLMRNGMTRDFSWDQQGPKYEELYTRLVGSSA